MCSKKCSKIALIVLNILFILLGLGLIIPGILVVVDEDVVNDKILPALKSVEFGVSNLGDLAKGLSITLIVLGSFVLVLSFIGACGACCETKYLLVIYMVIVFILLISKFVIVILWAIFHSKIESKLKDEMKTALTKFKNDDLTTHEISTGWNHLQMNFQCCGIDAVTTTTNDYDGSTWQVGLSNGNPTEVPLSCCPGVTSSSYTSASATNALCPSNKGTAPVGHYSTGCYDAVKDFAKKYSIAFICVGVFILIVEIAAIIFACKVCKNLGKNQIV